LIIRLENTLEGVYLYILQKVEWRIDKKFRKKE
jgi:hypothetical protein